MLSKQNTAFFQSAINDLKMGAFYTDVEEMQRLSGLFDFSQAEEVCAFDPCAGNGAALRTVTGCRDNVKTYGVELNEESYSDLLKSQAVDNVLNADFLQEVRISNCAFSFVFMNPPYGKTSEGSRYEVEFMKRLIRYIAVGGVFVLVVPYYVMQSEEAASLFGQNFELKHMSKFHAKEFSRFKQVVLVGIRREVPDEFNDDRRKILTACSRIEEMQEVPSAFENKIVVKSSHQEGVSTFSTERISIIDVERASKESKLYELVDKATRIDSILNVGQPPIPIREDHAYLMATTGISEGIVGSAENKDLHLQRGSLEKGIKEEYERRGEKSELYITESTLYKTTLTTVENNGEIKRHGV